MHELTSPHTALAAASTLSQNILSVSVGLTVWLSLGVSAGHCHDRMSYDFASLGSVRSTVTVECRNSPP